MRRPNIRGRSAPLVLVILAIATIGVRSSCGADEQYDSIISKDVMVPMRDGTRLATDIYRPARNGEAVQVKFPAILVRSPYPKEGQQAPLQFFAAHGYVGIAQNVRGRYASEGHWRMLRDDTNDGFDTVQWIGRQPWFDGNLGTVGGSYDGGTQYALAISNPPYLKAMIPAYAMSDCGVYGIRHHGAFELRWMDWILLAARDSHYPAAGTAIKNPTQLVEEYAKGLPLHAGATLLSLAPDYESWLVEAMNHGDDDKYWKDMGASVVDHVAEVKDVPILHISGWYDSWAGPTANLNYVELSKSKNSQQRLIMGPWTHGGNSLRSPARLNSVPTSC